MGQAARRVRRWGGTVLGWVLTVVGVVLVPLPGPGLLVMVVGLALLAERYTWAARGVDQLKRRALLEAARGVRTTGRATTSIVVAVLLTASGALWVWEPARPAWWVLPAWTWLPGGLWSGVSQALPGLATLVLVLWAFRRYHGRPELVAALELDPEPFPAPAATGNV